MDDFQILDDHIARLRVLVDLPKDGADRAAGLIRTEIGRQVAAGTDPEGKPWAPRKADGAQPLVNAAKDIRVAGYENLIVVRILARELVLHHYGYARGNVRRQIIPIGKLPDSWASAIKKSLEEEFAKTMGVAA
jgi:hypothetical protein